MIEHHHPRKLPATGTLVEMASFDYGELLSQANALYEQHQRFLPMYCLLLASALFPIYTGAHASLSRPSSAAKPVKDETNTQDNDDEDDEENVQKLEGLSRGDALLFPVMAGGVLFTLYMLIQYFGASMINTILGVYFSVIGTYSVSKLISDTFSTAFGFFSPNYYSSSGKIWKVLDGERRVVAIDSNGDNTVLRVSPLAKKMGAVPLPAKLLDLAWILRSFFRQKSLAKIYLKGVDNIRITFTLNNIFASVLGALAIGYSLFIDKPWMLTNLQGFAVCYGAFQLMSPTTFGTGSLILAGLFFYDVWAVFFTPFMVTVAQNLDVPIKLVFPRPEDPEYPPEEGAKPNYSMLGLGDIVLPGLMIALALRFDLHMFYVRKQKTITKPNQGSDKKDITTTIEKAPYVSVSGNWAEWLYTAKPRRNGSSALPAHLSSSFPKTYFHSSIVGYVIGMITTLVVMSVFQHAQPALLYLVPSVLISIWGTGLVRGELKAMCEYTEDIAGEAVEDDRSDAKEEVEAEDSKKEKATSEDKTEVVRPADVGENVTFSFTITTLAPSSSKISSTAKTTGSKAASKKSDRQSQASSTSTDEDGILVGSADLEGHQKTS